MPTLVVSTSLRPSRSKTIAPVNTSACHLFANLGRKISSTSGDDSERALLFCREFRCWCSATTLYCYMTPCQPLTARTDDLYQLCILSYLNFLTTSGSYLPRVSDNNNSKNDNNDNDWSNKNKYYLTCSYCYHYCYFLCKRNRWK